MAIKKRRRPKTNRDYFTQETEDAIILYNKLDDSLKKSRLYQEKIHYAFFKLTQNIIHTFKFYNTEVSDLEHLQHEIIVFLLSKIHLFNHAKNLEDRFKKIIIREFKGEYNHNFQDYVDYVDKVTQQQINDFIELLSVSEECLVKLNKLTPPKAFSYFGTITKRWLIVYNDKNYTTKINSVPTDELFKNNSNHTYLLDDHKDHNDRLSLFMDSYIDHVTENIFLLFPKKQDAKVADAILDLFRIRENIDIFNKKALYFEIREKGDFKTPKITKIAGILYEMFQKHYTFYLEHDYMDFKDLQV